MASLYHQVLKIKQEGHVKSILDLALRDIRRHRQLNVVNVMHLATINAHAAANVEMLINDQLDHYNMRSQYLLTIYIYIFSINDKYSFNLHFKLSYIYINKVSLKYMSLTHSFSQNIISLNRYAINKVYYILEEEGAVWSKRTGWNRITPLPIQMNPANQIPPPIMPNHHPPPPSFEHINKDTLRVHKYPFYDPQWT